MSLLTMIVNPERAKDLSDMMSKLDRQGGVIRDYEMKLDKNGISDKMHQAALFAMAPEAVVENKLAGRRDLDDCAKVRCKMDDMSRDKGEARGGNQPLPYVDQLKLREVTLDLADGSSEGRGDTSSVQKLAEPLSAIVETLNCATKSKSKINCKRETVEPTKLPCAAIGKDASQRQNVMGDRRGKATTKVKGSLATCAEELGAPHGCAPAVRDGSTTFYEETLDGEDATDDGCWEEEEEETPQLGNLGSNARTVSARLDGPW